MPVPRGRLRRGEYELKELIHALKEVYRAETEVVESLDGDDK